ncbi:MAG: hypothetical protein ACK4V1_11905 [Burkholderiaceae bacterium]
MNDAEFKRLLSICAQIAQIAPEGIVFIGGVAVYLHAINLPATAPFAEATHDADFYISLADMADLRDLEEVTPNRRLHKHQLIKDGFEFDIYTERQSALIVPYDAVSAHAVVYDGIRVASLEHLSVLKLEALRDRRASAKGEKDAKDLLRIAAIAARGKRRFDAALAAPYLRDEHLALLDLVERGTAALALAAGNAVVAKRLRQDFAALSAALKAAYGSVHGSAAARRTRR